MRSAAFMRAITWRRNHACHLRDVENGGIYDDGDHVERQARRAGHISAPFTAKAPRKSCESRRRKLTASRIFC